MGLEEYRLYQKLEVAGEYPQHPNQDEEATEAVERYLRVARAVAESSEAGLALSAVE
jgi:hypothetical protein